MTKTTYKAAKQFFNEISGAPYVHVIFEHSSNALTVVFGADS